MNLCYWKLYRRKGVVEKAGAQALYDVEMMWVWTLTVGLTVNVVKGLCCFASASDTAVSFSIGIILAIGCSAFEKRFCLTFGNWVKVSRSSDYSKIPYGYPIAITLLSTWKHGNVWHSLYSELQHCAPSAVTFWAAVCHRDWITDHLLHSNFSLLCPAPPGPPGGLLVKNVAQTSLELRWSRGYDNHSPIGKYIIMGRSSLSSEWKKMRTRECVCASHKF